MEPTVRKKVKDKFDKMLGWVAIGLFLLAIITFFIINSAVAVFFLVIYTIISIVKYLRRRMTL